jgi:hypothetical protein
MTSIRHVQNAATKAWFDKLTTGACPEPVEGCLRVFVADVEFTDEQETT